MLRLEFSLSPMLRFLRIRHLAVIDSVEVEFDPGFNVLTGETGAGKSILVEAVGLLLGGRASGDLVRTGEEPDCPDCASGNVRKQFSVFATHGGAGEQPSFGGPSGGGRHGARRCHGPHLP